tara:strand:+ start:1186 stop:1377 length:192 start_codon:yes stop_codon:yes gene_type:complete
MEKEIYRIGDKVNFKFIGVTEIGVIENISENQVDMSKHKLRFDIKNGKHSYPVGLENIIGKVK